MGIVAVNMKIMPASPETDLEEIKKQAQKLAEESGAKNVQMSEEAIAFGLKAVMAFFALDENNEIETLEEKIGKIDNVQSVQVVDMRRAFG